MATIINKIQIDLDQLPIETTNQTKRIVIKELLQSYLLSFIYNHSQYKKLNFYGGTCARVIYGLNRLSEDIDLDNSVGVSLDNFANDLTKYINQVLNLKDSDILVQGMGSDNLIQRFTLRVPYILKQLDLSSLDDEKLHVKVEISNHYQLSNIIQTPVIRHDQSFIASHFDKKSLFSGKILACLERVFEKGKTGILIKGRDYYDLIWYMQQQVEPLSDKLKKDGRNSYTVNQAFSSLEDKLKKITRNDLKMDLENLFLNQIFIDSWLDNFHDFFGRYKEFYKKTT